MAPASATLMSLYGEHGYTYPGLPFERKLGNCIRAILLRAIWLSIVLYCGSCPWFVFIPSSSIAPPDSYHLLRPFIMSYSYSYA